MAPLHHHFELSGWAEPKVIVRFWILVDPLRAALALDPEAAMKTPWRSRDGRDDWRRALVYGLGPLRPRRGAPPPRPRRRGRRSRRRSRPRSSTSPASRTTPDSSSPPGTGWPACPRPSTASSSRPGCRSDRPLLEDARRRGIPVVAEVELAFPFLDGPVVADHRQQRQEHDDGDDRRHAARGRDGGRGLRQHRPAARRGRRRAARPRLRRRAVELPDRGDRHLPPARGGPPQPLARPPRPLPHARRLRRRQEAALPRHEAEDVAVAERRRPRRRPTSRRPRAPAALLAPRRRSPTAAASRTAGGRGRAGHAPARELFARRATSRSPGVHNLENAMAAALLARAAGRRAGGDPRRRSAASAACPTASSGWARRAASPGTTTRRGRTRRATAKALEGFADGTVHLILGGRNKGADFAALAPDRRPEGAPRLPDRRGGARARARPRRHGRRSRSPARSSAPWRRRLPQPGPARRSSCRPPAPASTSSRNFDHRGEVFQALVRARLSGEAGEGA